MAKRTEWLILASILVIGALFRFYNLNWDQGHYFHPDERNIAVAVGKIRFFSQMNPDFFAYGSVPVYLYRSAADIVVKITGDVDWTRDWGKINLIGRHFSALFSTITVLLVYLLTRKILIPTAALVAAWVTATTPILIQQAHFSVTESMLAFWVVLLTYLTVQRKNPIILGCMFGLSVATKMSALSFGIIPIAMFIWKKQTKRIFIFLLTASLIYGILSPYTFLRWDKFMESMNYEGGIITGKLLVVYVYQFLQTQPYLYQLSQLPYTQGYVLAGLSIAGCILLIINTTKHKKWPIVMVFLWPLLYFLYVGSWFTKFVRYFVPLYPFLSIAAAYFIANLNKNIKWVFLAVLVISPFLRSIAFMHIYASPQTRIAASDWIYENVAKKSTILTEHWDDGLPLSFSPQKDPGIYQTRQLTIYEPDNLEKIDYYAENLSQADFLFINSRRLYGTLMHLSNRYPITSKYYKLLFNGSLGYKKVAEFTVYPTLKLGSWVFEFNDDNSEESFQVYDHRKVFIFENVAHLSKEQLKTQFL